MNHNKSFSKDWIDGLTLNVFDQINFEAPYMVEVRNSDIDGEGIFALMSFEAGQLVCSCRISNKLTTGGRYINHSEHPNCTVTKGQIGLYVKAIQPIAADEEITYDYKQASSEAAKFNPPTTSTMYRHIR